MTPLDFQPRDYAGPRYVRPLPVRDLHRTSLPARLLVWTVALLTAAYCVAIWIGSAEGFEVGSARLIGAVL